MAAALPFTSVKICCTDKSYQLFVDKNTLDYIKQDSSKYLNDIKASGIYSTLGQPFNLNSPTDDEVFVEIGDTLPVVANADGSLGIKANVKLAETIAAETSNGVQRQRNPVFQRAPAGQHFSWDRESIHYLIELRKNFHGLFERPPCTKAKLWEQLSEKMAKRGYKVSPHDCGVKWKNIVGTYRKNKEKLEREGNVLIGWEFFKPIDEILGEDFSLPTPSNLSSSQAPLPEPSQCSTNLKKRKKSSPSPSPPDHSLTPVPQQLPDEQSSSSGSGGGAMTPRSSSPEVHFPECVIPESDSSILNFAHLRRRKLKSDREPPFWFVKYMKKHDKEEQVFRNECIQLERERLHVERSKLNELRNRLSIEQQRVKELGSVKQLLTRLLDKLG